MAWQPMTIAGEADGIAHVWHSAGRWLMRDVPNEQYYRAADLAAIAASAKPGGEYGPVGDLPAGAATDGARWYVVGYWGAARSTDGLTGAAWEPIASAPGSLRVVGGHGGTVVVVNIGGYLKVSTDQGASWTDKAYFPGFGDEARWGITHTGTHLAAWAASGYLLTSADNGVTWQTRTPPIAVAEFAAAGGAWIIAPAGAGAAYVSTDQGVTWSPAGLDAGVARRLAATGGHAYQYEPATPRLQRSADLVQWEDIGLPAASPTPDRMVAGSGAVVLWSATAGTLPYYDPEPAPAYVQLSAAWPVAVVAPAGARVVAPWRVAIAAPRQIAAAHPVVVLSAATQGGLGGTTGQPGGWTAAPSGQWMALVTMGALALHDRLVGVVRVERAEDAAATAEFAYLPPAGVVASGALLGAPVLIQVAERVDGAPRNPQVLFRGVVEQPAIDAATGVITCRCHDQAQEIIARHGREQVEQLAGARWHAAVHDEYEDGWGYLEALMRQRCASWALDADQVPRVWDWDPAAAPDVALTEADLVDGSLAVTLPSRDGLIDRVEIEIQHTWPRLRGRGVALVYQQPLYFFVDAPRSREWLTTAMVEGAVDGVSGWTLRRPPVLVHPLPGAYPLGGGVYTISERVAPDLCLGVTAYYARRWVQHRDDRFRLVVQASAVTTLLAGRSTPPAELGATVSAEEAVPAGWESGIKSVPSIAIPLRGDTVFDHYLPGATPADVEIVEGILIGEARRLIVAPLRSARITCAIPARPGLRLGQRATITTPRISATGMLVAMTHVLDLDAGTALTELEWAQFPAGLPAGGDTVAGAYDPPPLPADPGAAAEEIRCGTYVGGSASASAPWDPETMVGFATNWEPPDGGSEVYPRQFSVQTPDVADADRDPLTVERGTRTISITPPTDTLEILS